MCRKRTEPRSFRDSLCKNRLLDGTDVEMVLVAPSRGAAAPAGLGAHTRPLAPRRPRSRLAPGRGSGPQTTGRSAVNVTPAPPMRWNAARSGLENFNMGVNELHLLEGPSCFKKRSWKGSSEGRNLISRYRPQRAGARLVKLRRNR